jgi:uncharacterized protein YprB with RNaseH-like and TPR domain
MSSLADKLKALGVKVGAQDLPSVKPGLSTPPAGAGETPPESATSATDMLALERGYPSLEGALGGTPLVTHFGETFAVETRYPLGQPFGGASLEIPAPLEALAVWAGNPQVEALPPSAFAFLDTETTGLSGGTGTYTFLIGVGRFEDDAFHLMQIFLRDPIEEPAQLAALEEFLAPCQALVTYNGKAFDVPLLLTRYMTHGWRAPLVDLAHLDLLHLARRLYRDRLPSRTLGEMEVNILGVFRTQEDIPGWMIPQYYFDYLRSGDPTPLKSVFYHNAMDVVSLAALLNHMATLLANPLEFGSQYSIDLISLGKLFEDLGSLELATRLYIHSLEHEDVQLQRLPRSALLQALDRLALIHKRQHNWDAAITLWQEAARWQHLSAYIEMAKYYEHTSRNYNEAMHWTLSALELLDHLDQAIGSYERRQWMAELDHRLSRLRKKLSGNIESASSDGNPASEEPAP